MAVPWMVVPSSLQMLKAGWSQVGAGVVEERDEAVAFDAGGELETGELDQGAVDVERLHDACGGAAIAVCSGHVDDERDAGAVFEERAGLGPLSFFA